MNIIEFFSNDFEAWVSVIACVASILSLIASVKSGSKLLKSIFVIIAIVSLVFLLLIIYPQLSKYFDNGAPAPTSSITAESTPSAKPAVNVSTDISTAEMIAWSNQEYRNIQKLKSTRTTDTLDRYAIAHTNYGKIRQIDVEATSSSSNYQPFSDRSAIYYYTESGELCFILLHYKGTNNDDVRFYVYKGNVVKYIGIDGVESYTVPNEYESICERGKNIYSTACSFLGISN